MLNTVANYNDIVFAQGAGAVLYLVAQFARFEDHDFQVVRAV